MIFPVACAPDILTMNMTHTGELGYVFYIPNEFALHVYDSILEAGKGGRGSAVGLQKKSLFGVTNGPVITGFEELPSFSRLPVILQYFVATANCKMVKNKTSFIHKNCSGVEPIFRSSSSIFFWNWKVDNEKQMLELNLWVGSGYGQERASAVRHLTFFLHST